MGASGKNRFCRHHIIFKLNISMNHFDFVYFSIFILTAHVKGHVIFKHVLNRFHTITGSSSDSSYTQCAKATNKTGQKPV